MTAENPIWYHIIVIDVQREFIFSLVAIIRFNSPPYNVKEMPTDDDFFDCW